MSRMLSLVLLIALAIGVDACDEEPTTNTPAAVAPADPDAITLTDGAGRCLSIGRDVQVTSNTLGGFILSHGRLTVTVVSETPCRGERVDSK